MKWRPSPRWVFEPDCFGREFFEMKGSDPDLVLKLSALRADWEFLNLDAGGKEFLIRPEKGHEAGVFRICLESFVSPPRWEAYRLLKKRSENKVHALKRGFSLCGFTELTPHDWPENHSWTEAGSRHVTCKACLEKMRGGKRITQKKA